MTAPTPAPARDRTARSAWILAAGIFAGLAVPPLASALRPLLPASVAGLLVVAMVRIGWAQLRATLHRPVAVAAVLAWLLVGSPLLAFAVVRACALPAGLAAAVVLMAAAPVIMAAPAFGLLLGLDPALMLAVVVLSTLIAPLTLGALASALLGAALELDPVALAGRLAAFIALCVALAATLRVALGTARIARMEHAMDTGAVVLLLVFAVAIMDGVGARLASAPGQVLGFVLAAFAANVLLQGAGALAAARLGRARAVAIGFATGNRNMGILLAVLPAGMSPDIQLYFALAQIPMFVLPALLLPLYRRVGTSVSSTVD